MTSERILVIGNSVSMSPRDGVAGYPALLKDALAAGTSCSEIIRSGATIDELEEEIASTLATFRPTVVVLQVGINECAPRPLARRGRDRLSRLRPVRLRQRIIQFLHAYRPQIIRLRGVHQLTPVDAFAAAVGRTIDEAVRHGARVVILPITRITPAAEERTPFCNQEVRRYNDALRALQRAGVQFVTEQELFGDQRPEDYCADATTVHLNGPAHARIAVFLRAWVERTAPVASR